MIETIDALATLRASIETCPWSSFYHRGETMSPPTPILSEAAYRQFLATKHQRVQSSGFDVPTEAINPKLYPFQRDIVRWALHLGRAAIFAAVGLGKTGMQLEYARHVARHTSGQVLILAPLAVAEQTVREGQKFGIEVVHVRDQSEISDHPIVITNYERLHLLDAGAFAGIVLDESSILKHYSKTFFGLTATFADTPYRLCCTATPAPNDYVEFGNHATFLGIMHFKDMMARWFIGEGDVARESRLKHYARADFWRWLTSWAVCISKPGDLGPAYDMPEFELPPLAVHEYRLAASPASIQRAWDGGRLLPDPAPSATAFQQVKRDSLSDRVAKAAEIVAGLPDGEPVVIWCDTDYEADALQRAFPEAVEVRGSHSAALKEARLRAFSIGEARMIITKAEIAGYGLNWQHCAQAIFAGVSYSFERTYQALGRFHRYGQTRPVHIHMIYAETEGNVMQTLQEKQVAFARMQAEMNAAMREHGLFREAQTAPTHTSAERDTAHGGRWTMHLGDCVEVMREMEADSIDLTVTSIPFSNLYVYSDKQADVGNAASKAEFFEHMRFVIDELYRITAPGRACAVHVKDLPLFIKRDGAQGIDPFSDDVSAAFRRAGWVLQSRITVGKDPVIEMRKTNSHGLKYMNWKGAAEVLRTGMPDYVLIFRKFVENGGGARVTHDPNDRTYFGDNPPRDGEWLTAPSRGSGANNQSLPVWQRYANPVWDDVAIPSIWQDINQTDVLNYLVAKDDRDERHICPLQLDLIARLIHWYTNPGETVFDPFGGIGSTVYQALKLDRRGVGIELKESYYELAVRYLTEVEAASSQLTLFDWAAQKRNGSEPAGQDSASAAAEDDEQAKPQEVL